MPDRLSLAWPLAWWGRPAIVPTSGVPDLTRVQTDPRFVEVAPMAESDASTYGERIADIYDDLYGAIQNVDAIVLRKDLPVRGEFQFRRDCGLE